MWLRGAASSFENVVSQVSRILNYVGIGALIAMMLLTVADVFLRYFFARPIMGSVEITESLMVIVAFFTVAWCAVKGGHIKVDLVVSHLPSRTQSILDSITCLISLIIAMLIAWRSYLGAGYMYEIKRASDYLEMPSYPFYYVMAIGCTVLCLALLVQLIHFITKAVKG